MKRKFVTNLALLVLLNILIKPFWMFGIDRGVQNAVGSEEYGLYFSLFNFSLLLNILLDIGITNYNNRNIAMHNQLLSKHLSNVVVIKLILSVVYFLVCFGIALIIGYDSKQLYLLIFLVFNQFILSFILYLRSNLSALYLFKTDSFISVLDRLLMIIICSVLLWGNISSEPIKIEWFVYAQTSAYLITLLVAFFIVFKKLDFFKLHFDRPFFIVFLRQSYPYALLILLMAFYNRIDSVMLERMLINGKEQAGIYAQSFRILDAASMFSFLFAGLLLPIFSKMIKNKESIIEMVQLSLRMILTPALIFVVAAIFYSNEIMNTLYISENMEYSSQVFSYLIPGYVAISITYIYGTLLTANGNLKALNILALSAMFLNVVLNLFLIPLYQSLGCAVSSIITQFYMAFGQIYLSQRMFSFKPNWIFILQFVFTAFVLIEVGYMTKKYIDNWFVGFVIMGIVGLVFSFGIKLLHLKGLYQIIKFKDE